MSVGDVISMTVVSVVMLCAVAGAIASLFDEEQGLGKEFLEGLRSIGHIFIPVAGIMAAVPYLSQLVTFVVGPLFSRIGADKAMAATTFIAVDMGGYQLAFDLKDKDTLEGWIMAMITGTMAGATIVFSIPVGLNLLDKRDHKYMALGALSGIVSIPVGVLVACLAIMLLAPSVRPTASTGGEPSHALTLHWSTVLQNLAPLAVIVAVFAAGLHFLPRLMIRGFMVFGRVMDVAIKLVLVCAIIEYFSATPIFKPVLNEEGIFTKLFGAEHWRFAPIVGTDRALEVAGYIGMMLAGAFPMVYLIKKFLGRPMEIVGRKLGLEAAGAAGLLAAMANILAMFRLVRDMRPQDKVQCIAFGVCAAFLFGDHLAFTANYQPTLLPAVMLGKFSGGVFAFVLARWISAPRAVQLEKEEREAEVRQLASLAPALASKSIEVSPLEGGMTNSNFLLRAEGETYVLRIEGAETELLGVDRERETACLHAAAGAGVGPEVVAHFPEKKTLIRRYLPGKSLTNEQAHQPAVLRRAAQALRRCHDYPAPPDLGFFSPFEAVRSYHALARARGIPLPATLPQAMEAMNRIERELLLGERGAPGDHALCLCHADLLPANLIDDGQTLRIIDWEYAGLGDRYFDLGNLAANFEMNAAQEEQFVEDYWGERSDERLRRLRLMRLVSDLREATWAYLQAGISHLHKPAYFRAYGDKRLDRFLAAADLMSGKR